MKKPSVKTLRKTSPKKLSLRQIIERQVRKKHYRDDSIMGQAFAKLVA